MCLLFILKYSHLLINKLISAGIVVNYTISVHCFKRSFSSSSNKLTVHSSCHSVGFQPESLSSELHCLLLLLDLHLVDLADLEPRLPPSDQNILAILVEAYLVEVRYQAGD